MGKKAILTIHALLVFVWFASFANAQTEQISVNFEEGGAWNYGDYFDIWEDSLESNWTITTTNPHGGTYCAESNSSGGTILNAAAFHFTIVWQGWGSETFLEYWLKLPTDFEPEATDANRGGNQHRYGYGGSGGDWTPYGGEYLALTHAGGSWLNIYQKGLDDGSAHYLADNQWHKYSWYFKMPSVSEATDAIWRVWRDDAGTYLTGNALENMTGFTVGTEYWSHVLFGNYWKGACSGNTTFWIDDIKIWDGMPTAEPEPPAALTGCVITGASIQ